MYVKTIVRGFCLSYMFIAGIDTFIREPFLNAFNFFFNVSSRGVPKLAQKRRKIT